MRGLALCAGIGGIELGVSVVMPGYRTVCFVEGEAYAAATLEWMMGFQTDWTELERSATQLCRKPRASLSARYGAQLIEATEATVKDAMLRMRPLVTIKSVTYATRPSGRATEIHKAPCRHCPSAHHPPDPLAMDLEAAWRRGEVTAQELVFECGWRPGRLCRGICDRLGVDRDMRRMSCFGFSDSAGYCCGSCHEDYVDYGYDLMEPVRPLKKGKPRRDPLYCAEVCCGVKEWLGGLDEEDLLRCWVRAVNVVRQVYARRSKP